MSRREQLVSGLSSYLRSLSRSRPVTADDAHRFFENRGYRGKTNSKLSITRSVLCEPNFMPVGMISSGRPEARNRRIRQWQRVS